MVVGFTYLQLPIQSVPITTVQHYVKKFVGDLRLVGGFLRFPPTINTDRHDVTEMLRSVYMLDIFTIEREYYKVCQLCP
jgi:hypothetical protein